MQAVFFHPFVGYPIGILLYVRVYYRLARLEHSSDDAFPPMERTPLRGRRRNVAIKRLKDQRFRVIFKQKNSSDVSFEEPHHSLNNLIQHFPQIQVFRDFPVEIVQDSQAAGPLLGRMVEVGIPEGRAQVSGDLGEQRFVAFTEKMGMFAAQVHVGDAPAVLNNRNDQ